MSIKPLGLSSAVGYPENNGANPLPLPTQRSTLVRQPQRPPLKPQDKNPSASNVICLEGVKCFIKKIKSCIIRTIKRWIDSIRNFFDPYFLSNRLRQQWEQKAAEPNLTAVEKQCWKRAALALRGYYGVLDLKINSGEAGFTELPWGISSLPNLRRLELNYNCLPLLSPKIGKLKYLNTLKVENNGLTCLPAEIGKLKRLERLYLSDNELSCLPPEIGRLKKLECLMLSWNGLSLLPPEIGHLKNLRELWLNRNCLTELPPQIGCLSKLKELNLQDNRLNELTSEIGALKSLKRLILGYNILTAVPAEIGQLEKLTQLQLTCNRLTTLPIEVGNLKKLKNLDLTNNHFQELPEAIFNLSPTCFVDVSDNPLLETEIARIREMTLRQTTSSHAPQGPRIHFSIYEARGDTPVRKLSEAITSWQPRKEQAVNLAVWEAFEKEINASAFSQFLDRLGRTHNIAQTSSIRLQLTPQVSALLEGMKNSKSFRQLMFGIASGALETCGDRLLWDFNQMQQGLLTHEIEDEAYDRQLDVLIDRARQAFRFEKLVALAKAKSETLQFIDEIEVYLAYQVQLRDELKLTTVSSDMLYFGASGVNENDLNLAEQTVKALENQEFFGWLAKFERWKKMIARRAPQLFEANQTTARYEQLERLKNPDNGLSEQEKIDQMEALSQAMDSQLTHDFLAYLNLTELQAHLFTPFWQ